jgi:hypothetical protein
MIKGVARAGVFGHHGIYGELHPPAVDLSRKDQLYNLHSQTGPLTEMDA